MVIQLSRGVRHRAIFVVQLAIQGVLSREEYSKKHIITTVRKGCNKMLNNFRTEERWKVITVGAVVCASYNVSAGSWIRTI